MAHPAASQRVYNFDEFLSGFWKWQLLHRQLPEGKLKVTQIKGLVIAAFLSCLQITFLSTKIIQYVCSKPVDWDIVVEATALLCPISMSIFQGISHLINQRFIERLVSNLEKLFPQTRAEQNDYNLEPYADELIRHRNFIERLSRYTVLVFNCIPLIQNFYEWLILGNDFPFRSLFRSWYPVNPRSWVFYPFLWLFEITTSSLCGFYLINDYVFHALATGQMRMHYRHLGRLMSELDATKEEANKCSNLGRLVDYHCALDKLRDDVNEIFNVTTFISFSFTKLTMCLVMYSFLYGKNLIVLPTLLAVFILLVLLVFLRCSNGSVLYIASEELVYKIYNSNWYEGSPRYRKMLALMMTRAANKPVELHALKIQKIRMETFKEIVMEAYQIFMFLLRFFEHQRVPTSE